MSIDFSQTRYEEMRENKQQSMREWLEQWDQLPTDLNLLLFVNNLFMYFLRDVYDVDFRCRRQTLTISLYVPSLIDCLSFIGRPKRLIGFRSNSDNSSHHTTKVRQLVSVECNLHLTLLINLTDQNHEHGHEHMAVPVGCQNPEFNLHKLYNFLKGKSCANVYTCDQESLKASSVSMETKQSNKFPFVCIHNKF